ncbi:MAG: DMT family transporter [Hyphomonas sp.]
MNFRDFALLFLICLVWGLNVVLSRWVVADQAIPPLFFAGIRFLGVGLCLIPFLRPRPQSLRMMVLISLFIGSLHFALLFMGLRFADASAAAITSQLGVPFSTLMSMAFLGETIGWRRGLGIMLAFAGVVLIALDPAGFDVSFGLLFIVASAFIGSAGGILMKRIKPMNALQMQAWIGALSFAPLFLVSFFVEQNQIGSYMAAGWPVWLATVFAIVGVSIFGHGAFYTLIKKYDISLLTPLTLMTPIWGVIFGITLLNEPITARLILGSVISLAGVFIIAIRGNKKLPEAGLGTKFGLSKNNES